MSSELARIPVAILAGGLGTRLRPAIGDRAKVVAEVVGRPFLTHLLDQLAAAGFRDVVLCVGHRADEVESALGDSYGGLRLRYSREASPLGTGGAIALAAPLLDAPECMVMNGDSWCEVDLAAAWATHRERGAEATLVVVEVPDASRYGRVELGAGDRVVGFAEKQEGGRPGWINAGIYLLSRARLASIEQGRALSFERDVLPGWVRQGLFAHRTRGRFIDIGTPGSYAEAATFFSG